MKKLYRSLSLTAVFLLMLASVVQAQQRVVTGTVTDESGTNMPGVNVLIRGTATGTATDTDGKFSISIPDDQAVLVFTFVGYASSEIIVGARSVVNTQLTPDVQTLTELVVTGYTSQRKADITGAVSVVDPEQLKTYKSANFGQMLAGRAPGVTTSTSGAPGDGTNILIRGVSSFGSSDPLVIVDGVQIQGDKALNGINPNDIESMQVLKDAASASIYGARAASGVIIITTKQGKSGKVQVTYDGYYGSQTPVGGYNDILVKDPLAYAQQYHTIKNPGSGTFYGGVGSAATIPEYFYMDNPDPSTYNYPTDPRVQPTLFMKSNPKGTDWWAETFHSAPIMDHNITISGGSDKGTLAASVDYFKQDGTMKYTYFERFSARLNGTLKAGRFTLGQSLAFTRSVGVSQRGGNQNEQNVMTQILKMNSIVPVYDISGVNFASAKTVNFSNGSNPLALSYRNKDNTNTSYRLIGGVNGEFKITDYLSFKTAISYDLSQNLQKNFTFPTWENREFNNTNSYQEQQNIGFNYVWTNTLNFHKILANDHNVSAFVGYEAVKNDSRFINAQVNGFGFTSTDIRYVSQPLSTVLNSAGSGYNNLNTIASMFAKVDYSFKDKYILSATIRRDGSSNFSPSQRYGNFPAFSAGWRLSEESFLQGATWLDDLKIRGGYGVTGNQRIPAFNAYDRWGARSPFDASYDITGSNTGSRAGYALTNYGDPQTHWEENRMSNIGFDATLLNGKFSVVFDWFNKDVKDLLYQVTYPGLAGAAQAPVKNVAEMTNKGWDGAINYREKIGGLGLNVGLNVSHYVNNVVKLDGNTNSFFPPGIDKRFGELNVWQVGSPISSFYGYTQNGLFQNSADTAALVQSGEGFGRLRWADISGPNGKPDGKITDADKGVIGSPQPKITMGLNIGLTYKAFDFSMFLFGSFGNKIYNYNRLFTHFGFFNSNIAKEVLTNSWTSEGHGTLPAIDPNDNQSVLSSTFYVEDGSYIRAQNMTLGYTLPKNKVFEKLRIYVQGQNMFTITKYKGIDPALSNVNPGNNGNNNNGWMGFDFGNYPSSKTFMVGVNATF